MTHTDTTFGTLWSKRDLEEATADTIHKWIGDYVEWINQVRDETLHKPKRYDFSNSIEDFDINKLPHVLVICPGMARSPIKDGDGYWRSFWTVGIGCVVSANNADNVSITVGLYGAALRNIMLHKRTLDGKAEGNTFEDERYDDIPSVDNRSLAAVRLVYTVEVRDIARDFGGPAEPINAPDPDQPWPSVAAATVEGGTL